MSDKNDIKRAPDAAFDKAMHVWFENYGSSVVEKTRWFVVAMTELGVIFAMGLAIAYMAPLKTVVPYVVNVADTGQVTATNAGVSQYQPGEKEIRFFLAQWVTKMYTLDRMMTVRYLKDAYALTRDKAVAEFTDWLESNKPIASLEVDQGITQGVTIKSISFVGEGVALVRFRYTTRAQQKAITTDKLLTIHYSLIPPTTDQQIYENPLGLYITHFAVSEDIQ